MIRINHFIKRFLSDSRGSAAIEFSMTSLAFVAITLMIFEMGRLLWTLNGIQYATEHAARYAAIHTDESEEEVMTLARTTLGDMAISTNGFDVQVNSVVGATGSIVEVAGNYPYAFGTLFFLPESLGSFTLSSVSRRPELPE